MNEVQPQECHCGEMIDINELMHCDCGQHCHEDCGKDLHEAFVCDPCWDDQEREMNKARDEFYAEQNASQEEYSF